ncbi:MAG TPA: nicotinate phosphoribosyltransferase [Terracidiphilus sp.]
MTGHICSGFALERAAAAAGVGDECDDGGAVGDAGGNPVIVNLARRAHDHNWELDPITRSLLDTDFYKLLMLQFIWKHFPKTRATFTLSNRTASVPLGEIVDLHHLREQLEATRSLRFHKSELIWLAGNTFYGKRGIFESAFIEWLEKDFQLSEFELAVEDGQISLRFEGLWTTTTLWEIYALAVVDELKTRANLKTLTEFELDILYARAKTRLWEKMERLRGVPGLNVSDFGTRRRHSFLWQEYVVKAMSDVLGPSFAGSSNTYLAYKHDLEAIGTNAHELPMAMAALADTDEDLKSAQYRLLELWQQTYQGELLILLPDTFGTTQFLRDAPDWVARWTGQRVDSKDPFAAGDEYIEWLTSRGCDPRKKRLIASDALDVDSILALHAAFAGRLRNGASPWEFKRAIDFADRNRWTPERRIRFSAGWGTYLTNDFRNCNPHGDESFHPVSLVCKLSEVDGRPAVKLSDNSSKALGPAREIERYRRVFGSEGVSQAQVDV